MTGLNELLADCDARGIRLLPSSDGGLTMDAPQDAVTPELLDELRQHKSDLLRLLSDDPRGQTEYSRLVAEMMDRVAEAFPAGCDISEQDWRRLDVIHEWINAARRRRGLTDLRDQIAQYESTALEVARGTILAPQEGIR